MNKRQLNLGFNVNPNFFLTLLPELILPRMHQGNQPFKNFQKDNSFIHFPMC